jgi:hypothetical protein
MLRIDPKMLERMEELEADLLVRRARAEAEGGSVTWKASTSP